MVHGPQQAEFALHFELPSACADSLASGRAAIGLVPAIEALRQKLALAADVGIISIGPVRSIFLINRVPVRQIRSVALDSSSRTSAALTRILLRERYGISPEERPADPDPDAMLRGADAALLIGDPALRLDLTRYEMLDLGEEWRLLTNLPMVYAIWAGKPEAIPEQAATVLRSSYEYGRARLDDIVTQEAPARQIPLDLAKTYLTRHIHYELTPLAREGLAAFERLARQHGLL